MNAPIDVIGRAALIMRTISTHAGAGMTTTAVANAVGLARPTTHRLLTSLLTEGLADRDAEGRWHLGPELYLMGTTAAGRYDIAEVAHPFITQLAAKTGESAFFSARRGDETVCLLREEGSFPIRSHVLYEGIRFPLGVASAGLAVLAHLGDREIDEYLSRADLVSSHGPEHSSLELRKRIQKTRNVGYSVNPGLIVEGSWGVGAAVFDHNGKPRWAVSLTGVEHRISGDRRERLGDSVLRTAHSVTNAVSTRVRLVNSVS